jgi:hypothetical protein
MNNITQTTMAIPINIFLAGSEIFILYNLYLDKLFVIKLNIQYSKLSLPKITTIILTLIISKQYNIFKLKKII